ncbi:MAG: HAMP domain-containing histidine kinase, partial [Halobacteriales archaeon]|nr:HAMP domain-containing histidine kinase [Halobacteriales archaeon]
RDGQGTPVTLSGTVEDVTDRVQAEEQRLQLVATREERRRLAETNEFKTRFLGMVAHDMNNVVTPLRLSAATLADGLEKDAAPQRVKAVAILQRAVERLAGFLADLLDAARLQSGHLAIDAQPFDLSQQVGAALDALQDEADVAGLRIERDIVHGVEVRADARRIDQVTTNLLGNALKFTPSGGRISVSLRTDEAAVEFAVADTGPGLSADDLGSLFEPFTQLGSAPQGKHTGTGLGLFICRGIVEAHGGTIRCESEGPGKGARFVVRLLKGAAAAAPAASGASA